MKARYSPTDHIEFEIEGSTQKDVFTALSQTCEVFGESRCGKCDCTDLYYKTRISTAKKGTNKGKSFTYFEIVCRGCGYFLPIGQHNNDKGTLFPDRKIVDANGDLVYDKKFNGWRQPANRKDDAEE